MGDQMAPVRPDGRPDDCWATRLLLELLPLIRASQINENRSENLVTNLVAGIDLVAHLVAGASGRRSGRGRCGHLQSIISQGTMYT